jgi:hypothetical protein
MEIHAFRGPGRVFGFTRRPDGGNLPPGFGPWTAFKALDLERGRPQPGVDVDQCIDDLEAHGFHLTDAHVRITDRGLSGAG